MEVYCNQYYYLLHHGAFSFDMYSLVPRLFLPPVFDCAIKNWRQERPGNEAIHVHVFNYVTHAHFSIEWHGKWQVNV